MADRIHVAMATRFPYQEKDGFSGMVQLALRLCEALARRPDIELDVVAMSDQVRRVEQREQHGYRVTFFPRQNSLRYYGTLIVPASLAMSRELRRIKPDIVHIQAIGETAVGTLLSGLPHVASIHGIYAEEARSAKLLKDRLACRVLVLNEEWYVPRLRHVMTCSPYIARFVEAHNRKASLYAVSNPIDPVFFQADALRQRENPYSVLMLAGVSYRKGHDLLLSATEQLLGRFPQMRVTIVGPDVEPEFAAQMRARIEASPAREVIRWLGPIEQERLVEEMSCHQVLCLPSRADTMPMVISQALAMGNLVVASDAGGIPDMIKHEVHGYLFPKGDEAALVAALDRVFQLSAEQAATLRLVGRRYAEANYFADGVAAQMVGIYRRILGRPVMQEEDQCLA
jgi:glycosyltransferase involved in cell wall biosynthesis